jgi:hypothetical protein
MGNKSFPLWYIMQCVNLNREVVMKKILFFVVLAALFIAGCQESNLIDKLEEKAFSEKAAERGAYSGAPETKYAAGEADMTASYEPAAPEYQEKIIRTAYVTIRSANVKEAYDRALILAKKYNGIIVNSSSSKYEDYEEAMVEIKVPPQHFMTVLEEAKEIGEVETKNISEEDVTEEYYDIRARLENKQKVRERLFDLLRKAYKVEDILKVEHEIERVGEEIERLEGRLRYLESKTDYSRITFTIYNRDIPVFEKMGIKDGFVKSIQFSIKFFFGIIWFIIVLIPLFIIIAILWIIIVWIIRRKRKRT